MKRPENAPHQMLMRFVAAAALAFLCMSGSGREVLSAERGVKDETLLLAATPDGEAIAKAPQPIARVIQHLRPRTGVMAVAWSPDGKLLATMGGLQERIALWDPRSGKMLWEKVGDVGGGEALAFSNDGRLLLAPAAKAGPEDDHTTLTLWDVATGTVAGHVAGPYPNEGVAWNFARKMALDRERGLMAVIAVSDPGSPVGIYDTHDWMLKGTVAVEKEWPKVVAFGPGSALAVGMVSSKIALFDARTRAIKRTIDVHRSIRSLAYSPDGKFVVSGVADAPDPIQIWSTADGTLVRSYAGNRAEVVGLAWSPDGRYVASASYDRTIRLWPAATDGPGEIVATLSSGVSCVAFSPDGAFLAGGSSEDDAIVAEIK
jgi:WD40 repeat protein